MVSQIGTENIQIRNRLRKNSVESRGFREGSPPSGLPLPGSFSFLEGKYGRWSRHSKGDYYYAAGYFRCRDMVVECGTDCEDDMETKLTCSLTEKPCEHASHNYYVGGAQFCLINYYQPVNLRNIKKCPKRTNKWNYQDFRNYNPRFGSIMAGARRDAQ